MSHVEFSNLLGAIASREAELDNVDSRLSIEQEAWSAALFSSAGAAA
jgi:hypothetical protein